MDLSLDKPADEGASGLHYNICNAAESETVKVKLLIPTDGSPLAGAKAEGAT